MRFLFATMMGAVVLSTGCAAYVPRARTVVLHSEELNISASSVLVETGEPEAPNWSADALVGDGSRFNFPTSLRSFTDHIEGGLEEYLEEKGFSVDTTRQVGASYDLEIRVTIVDCDVAGYVMTDVKTGERRLLNPYIVSVTVEADIRSPDRSISLLRMTGEVPAAISQGLATYIAYHFGAKIQDLPKQMPASLRSLTEDPAIEAAPHTHPFTVR